mmetsp:Transcript_15959/g.21741  ORF Transcript_15959/g.21741 Transcript_15959/m.21741 type:complete len:88 (+) Transcript_15959:920-1183(+)
MFYGPVILISTGFTITGYSKEESGVLLNIPVAFTNAVGSSLSLLMIDRLGRRYMMLRFLPLISLSLFTISTGMYLDFFTEVSPATIG